MTITEPTEPRADDFVLEINGRGGIPLSMASYLLRAIGALYPNTAIKPGTRYGPTLQLLIPQGDLSAADAADVTAEDLAALGGEKDVAELTAFTSGWRDGTLGLRPPPWLSSLLQTAAQQMVDAMPPTAENYVAIEIKRPGAGHRPDQEPFTWIVCRPGRPSPHDLRKRAEEERDRLRELLAEVLGELNQLALGTYGEEHPNTEQYRSRGGLAALSEAKADQP